MEYIKQYIADAKQIIDMIDIEQIQMMINLLNNLKESKGRLFILGVGVDSLFIRAFPIT